MVNRKLPSTIPNPSTYVHTAILVQLNFDNLFILQIVSHTSFSHLTIEIHSPPGGRRRRQRAMADPGAEDQGHAPDLRPGRGGHDRAGRPPRGGDTQEPAHQIQREPHLRESELWVWHY